MRKALIVTLAGPLAGLGVALAAGDFQPYPGGLYADLGVILALVGVVLGLAVWAAGRVRRRDSRAAAATVAAVCAVPLLAVPVGYALDRWDIHRERAARPWTAAMDSVLAVHPHAGVSGTYWAVLCYGQWAPCAPGDTEGVAASIEITLLPQAGPSDEPGRSNGCLRALERDETSGRLVRSGGGNRLRWTRRRDGAVEIVDLDTESFGGSETEVAVTPGGLVGGSVGWSDVGGDYPPTYLYLAGRRTESPDPTACRPSGEAS